MKKIYVYTQYEEAELVETVCSFDLDKLLKRARDFEDEILNEPEDEEERKEVWNHIHEFDGNHLEKGLMFGSLCNENNGSDYIPFEIYIHKADFIE